MPWVSLSCPKCDGEIRALVIEMEGGYPGEVLMEIDDWESPCGCSLDTMQTQRLEDEAYEKVDWSDDAYDY